MVAPGEEEGEGQFAGEIRAGDFSRLVEARNDVTPLDFADATVDNNEANPLGFYRYVFSTDHNWIPWSCRDR